jgi:putative FmdB family regulatory protein
LTADRIIGLSMPIYEYKRPDGSTFELVQPFSDDALTHDPDTGVPVERVLHAPALHFKGKGFYNTDYGTRRRQRENAAASSEESKSANGSSESKDTSSSETTTKPESGATDSKKSEKSEAKPVAAKS